MLLWRGGRGLHRLGFFFFSVPATPEIYTLSLHDALPISSSRTARPRLWPRPSFASSATGSSPGGSGETGGRDRKSTRLNSSHLGISYAVFCLKKKKSTSRHSPPGPTSRR